MIRVGFHTEAQSLVIEGCNVYPARSLTVHPTADEGFYEIWSLAGRSERKVRWSEVAPLLGEAVPFATEAEAISYLEEEFAKPPASQETEAVAVTPLGGHRVVWQANDGITYASSDDPDSADAVLGITTGAVDAGEAADVLRLGPLTEPSWSWARGPVYLGPEGMLVQPAPSHGVVLQVAAATSPTTIFVSIQEPYHLAA